MSGDCMEEPCAAFEDGAHVKLTHAATGYIFPAEVLLNHKDHGQVTFTLARNPITHVHVLENGKLLLNGRDYIGARFVVSPLRPCSDDAHTMECRIACVREQGWFLGMGIHTKGKYGNVVETEHVIGNAGLSGTDSVWRLERAPPIAAVCNQSADAWQEHMALTSEQKASFMQNGFLVVPSGVPIPVVDAALDVIDQKVQGEGGRAWYENTEGKAQTFPEVMSLFWDDSSAVQTVAQSLLGRGNVSSVERVQIALRFPEKEGRRKELDPSGWHVDGTIKGVHSPFTLLVGVALSDIPLEPKHFGGGFVVYPGSHITLQEEMLKFADGTKPNAFEHKGLAKPELPGATQLMACKGDIILAHQKLAHCGGPNYSPHIRYTAYFRVTHKCHSELADAALNDLFLEYEGLAL